MHIIILVTAGSKKEAEKISREILKHKLAACVNIVDKIDSFFWWKGKVDNARESLLVLKTKKSLLAKVIKRVKSVHSYDVPEIIAIPIIGGEKSYLRWLDESVRKPV